MTKWVYRKFKCECGKEIHKGLEYPIELDTETIACECGKKAFRTDLNFKGSSKAIMDSVYAEGGVRIFENGKRKTLNSVRAVKEYAARNNCTFGGDDTEQEARHQRELSDKQYVENISSQVANDFERLRYSRNSKKRQ